MVIPPLCYGLCVITIGPYGKIDKVREIINKLDKNKKMFVDDESDFFKYKLGVMDGKNRF